MVPDASVGQVGCDAHRTGSPGHDPARVAG